MRDRNYWTPESLRHGLGMGYTIDVSKDDFLQQRARGGLQSWPTRTPAEILDYRDRSFLGSSIQRGQVLRGLRGTDREIVLTWFRGVDRTEKSARKLAKANRKRNASKRSLGR